MANVSVRPCSCPRCDSPHSKSVAAMNYAETRVWNRQGMFRGSGVGVGAGGISVVSTSGTYTERGVIATKRADEFAEPRQARVPVVGIVVPVVVAAFALANLPESFSWAGPGNSRTAHIESFILPLVGVGAAVAIAIGVAMAIFRLRASGREVARHNDEVHPRQMLRYQELRYCENCHTLFDDRKHAANATEAGFGYMMSIPPADQVAGPTPGA